MTSQVQFGAPSLSRPSSLSASVPPPGLTRPKSHSHSTHEWSAGPSAPSGTSLKLEISSPSPVPLRRPPSMDSSVVSGAYGSSIDPSLMIPPTDGRARSVSASGADNLRIGLGVRSPNNMNAQNYNNPRGSFTFDRSSLFPSPMGTQAPQMNVPTASATPTFTSAEKSAFLVQGDTLTLHLISTDPKHKVKDSTAVAFPVRFHAPHLDTVILTSAAVAITTGRRQPPPAGTTEHALTFLSADFVDVCNGLYEVSEAMVAGHRQHTGIDVYSCFTMFVEGYPSPFYFQTRSPEHSIKWVQALQWLKVDHVGAAASSRNSVMKTLLGSARGSLLALQGASPGKAMTITEHDPAIRSLLDMKNNADAGHAHTIGGSHGSTASGASKTLHLPSSHHHHTNSHERLSLAIFSPPTPTASFASAAVAITTSPPPASSHSIVSASATTSPAVSPPPAGHHRRTSSSGSGNSATAAILREVAGVKLSVDPTLAALSISPSTLTSTSASTTLSLSSSTSTSANAAAAAAASRSSLSRQSSSNLHHYKTLLLQGQVFLSFPIRGAKNEVLYVSCTEDFSTLRWGKQKNFAHNLAVARSQPGNYSHTAAASSMHSVLTGHRAVLFGLVKWPLTLMFKTYENRSAASSFFNRSKSTQRKEKVVTLNLVCDNNDELQLWTNVFKFLQTAASTVSTPFNVHRVAYLDTNLQWQSEDLLKQFKLGEKIGKGGFALVFQATHAQTGGKFAVKIFNNYSETTANEISILKECRSPYTIQYYGSVCSHGKLYVIMELADAGSLHDLLVRAKDKMKEMHIAYVVRCTLLALQYLHGKAIIHRDVKAANILLRKSGQVLLTDFGVSQKQRRRQTMVPSGSEPPSPALHREGVTLGEEGKELVAEDLLYETSHEPQLMGGSPLYMSPQALRNEDVDAKTDTWSLGITCIEIAEGIPPHNDMPSFLAIAKAVEANDPPTLLTHARSFPSPSAEFQDFVNRCLVKDSAERASVDELLSHPFVNHQPWGGSLGPSAVSPPHSGKNATTSPMPGNHSRNNSHSGPKGMLGLSSPVLGSGAPAITRTPSSPPSPAGASLPHPSFTLAHSVASPHPASTAGTPTNRDSIPSTSLPSSNPRLSGSDRSSPPPVEVNGGKPRGLSLTHTQGSPFSTPLTSPAHSPTNNAAGVHRSSFSSLAHAQAHGAAPSPALPPAPSPPSAGGSGANVTIMSPLNAPLLEADDAFVSFLQYGLYTYAGTGKLKEPAQHPIIHTLKLQPGPSPKDRSPNASPRGPARGSIFSHINLLVAKGPPRDANSTPPENSRNDSLSSHPGTGGPRRGSFSHNKSLTPDPSTHLHTRESPRGSGSAAIRGRGDSFAPAGSGSNSPAHHGAGAHNNKSPSMGVPPLNFDDGEGSSGSEAITPQKTPRTPNRPKWDSTSNPSAAPGDFADTQSPLPASSPSGMLLPPSGSSSAAASPSSAVDPQMHSPGHGPDSSVLVHRDQLMRSLRRQESLHGGSLSNPPGHGNGSSSTGGSGFAKYLKSRLQHEAEHQSPAAASTCTSHSRSQSREVDDRDKVKKEMSLLEFLAHGPDDDERADDPEPVSTTSKFNPFKPSPEAALLSGSGPKSKSKHGPSQSSLPELVPFRSLVSSASFSLAKAAAAFSNFFGVEKSSESDPPMKALNSKDAARLAKEAKKQKEAAAKLAKEKEKEREKEAKRKAKEAKEKEKALQDAAKKSGSQSANVNNQPRRNSDVSSLVAFQAQQHQNAATQAATSSDSSSHVDALGRPKLRKDSHQRHLAVGAGNEDTPDKKATAATATSKPKVKKEMSLMEFLLYDGPEVGADPDEKHDEKFPVALSSKPKLSLGLNKRNSLSRDDSEIETSANSRPLFKPMLNLNLSSRDRIDGGGDDEEPEIETFAGSSADIEAAAFRPSKPLSLRGLSVEDETGDNNENENNEFNPQESYLISREGTLFAGGFKITGKGLKAAGSRKSSMVVPGTSRPHADRLGSGANTGDDDDDVDTESAHVPADFPGRMRSSTASGLGGGDSSELEEMLDNDVEVCLSKDDLVELSVIGRGQNGSVLKAIHLPTLTRVALKTMSVYDRGTRHQLIHELTAYAKLHSPYLVSFLGAYHDSGVITMATEYMDCGSLQAFVKRNGGKLNEKVMKHIAYGSIQGLAYLHSQHACHRDIKPDNILLNHMGQIKIADFGLLKEMNGTYAVTDTFLGTMAYLSPERLLSNDYSYASDIWSMGLSIIYSLVGSLPLECTDYWQLVDMISNRPPPSLPKDAGFSKECIHFVDECLRAKPEDRASADKLLQHPWFETLEDTHHLPEWSIDDGDLDTILSLVVDRHVLPQLAGGNPPAPEKENKFSLRLPQTRLQTIADDETMTSQPSSPTHNNANKLNHSPSLSASVPDEGYSPVSPTHRSSGAPNDFSRLHSAPSRFTSSSTPSSATMSAPSATRAASASLSLATSPFGSPPSAFPELDEARLGHLAELFDLDEATVQQRFQNIYVQHLPLHRPS